MGDPQQHDALLPNFFERGQLAKIFICFPDPHFKRKNHRKRIVTPALCAEYSYALRDGGLLYAITDVAELMEWMVSHLTASPLFERLPNAALRADPAVAVLPKTDEGLKVRRNNGNMFIAVYRKRLDPLAPRPGRRSSATTLPPPPPTPATRRSPAANVREAW